MEGDHATLKDGTVVYRAAVDTTVLHLESISSVPGLLCELVEKCRDKDYQLKEPWLTRLRKADLVWPDGRVHDDIRAIVVNSVEGEDLAMRLVDPLRKE